MITGLIASLGMKLFDSYAEDVIVGGIKKVTGIDLEGKQELKPHEIETIKRAESMLAKELELIYADKDSAREMNRVLQTSKDWLVRNMGSLIAGVTVILTFMLDGYVLHQGISLGMEALNPIVTLISGAMTTRVMTIYSFYYGSSKNEADAQRK